MVRVNRSLKEIPAMHEAITVQLVDCIREGVVVGPEMDLYKIPDVMVSISIGNNRIKRAHQRNRYYMPSMLQIPVILLGVVDDVSDFQENGLFKYPLKWLMNVASTTAGTAGQVLGCQATNATGCGAPIIAPDAEGADTSIFSDRLRAYFTRTSVIAPYSPLRSD
jgi:hypothetical protein